MAGLPSFSYPGFGEMVRKTNSYSQVIQVGDTIVCSGQGGWNRTTLDISTDINEEVDQAFENVDATIKRAGGKGGWPQVYKVVTYSTDLKATHERIVANYRKWMPYHQPTWTEIGVKQLGLDNMRIEIEAMAYNGNGNGNVATT
ncbi:YjgF-like protein [Xylariaceae sp. FL0016]|nr:YjgF-like protein [Xylariaceae sp. FL0016]